MTIVSGLIPLDQIAPSSKNPRKSFPERDIADLAASILAAGKLHQAIKIRPIKPNGLPSDQPRHQNFERIGPRFEIVMGERRYRAHRLLVQQGHSQFAHIQAMVEDMNDDQAEVAAIVENLQRTNPDIIEEANAFALLMQKPGFDEGKVARLVGIDPHRVRERLALVELEPQVQRLVRSGQIAMTCGVEISRLPKIQQIAMVKRIGSGKLKGITEIRAAVNTLIERESQTEMLAHVPRANPEEIATVSRMEKKVEQIKAMVASGWKDGECVIARKVGPDRARKIAEELDAIRLHLSRMSKELREAAVQAELVA
jgi:ParB/RepB/Spo0J family partition protein